MRTNMPKKTNEPANQQDNNAENVKQVKYLQVELIHDLITSIKSIDKEFRTDAINIAIGIVNKMEMTQGVSR